MINNRGVSSLSKGAELQSPHRAEDTQQTLKLQDLPKPDLVPALSLARLVTLAEHISSGTPLGEGGLSKQMHLQHLRKSLL